MPVTQQTTPRKLGDISWILHKYCFLVVVDHHRDEKRYNLPSSLRWKATLMPECININASLAERIPWSATMQSEVRDSIPGAVILFVWGYECVLCLLLIFSIDRCFFNLLYNFILLQVIPIYCNWYDFQYWHFVPSLYPGEDAGWNLAGSYRNIGMC